MPNRERIALEASSQFPDSSEEIIEQPEDKGKSVVESVAVA